MLRRVDYSHRGNLKKVVECLFSSMCRFHSRAEQECVPKTVKLYGWTLELGHQETKQFELEGEKSGMSQRDAAGRQLLQAACRAVLCCKEKQ